MTQRDRESYMWTDNDAELFPNITLEYEVKKTQMPSDVSHPRCGE